MSTDSRSSKKPKKQDIEPQKFVDEIAGEFKNLWEKLEIKYDNFIRTTDQSTKRRFKKFCRLFMIKARYIKASTRAYIASAASNFRNENELVNGRCPDHDIVLEKIKEECYLLKLGDIQQELIEKIEKDEFAIRPEKYKKEILSFLKSEKLKDISISRKKREVGNSSAV